MPIDPRIPLAVGSMPVPDYASQYGQVLRLREMMRLADDRQQERDRLAEEEELRQRMRGAYAFDPEGNLDRPTTLKNFRDIDPVTALTIQEGWKTGDVAARQQQFEMDKAEQQAELSELVTAQKTMELAAKLAGSATDDGSFKLMQQEGLKHGLLTQEEVDEYPEFNTKAVLWLKQQQEQVRTAAERIQARQDDIAQKREKTEYEQGQLANAMELGGQLAPLITNQREYTTLDKMTGGRLSDIFGDTFSAGTQELMEKASMTPQQRATGAAAAEKLAATESAKQLAKQEKQAEHKRTRFQDLQAQEDKFKAEEDDLHAANEAIGRQLETIHQQFLANREGETLAKREGETKEEKLKREEEKFKQEQVLKDPVLERTLKRNRVELERELAEGEGKIANLQRQRADIIQRKNRVYGQPGRGGRPTAGAAATRAGKPRGGRANTEADIRRRAKESGIDPDILVEDARALGLLR